MQMTGHKTRSVFERYNIVSGGDLREAAKRLDARDRDNFRDNRAKSARALKSLKISKSLCDNS